MVFSRCNGGAACFCPVASGNAADCFVIWGWIILITFIVCAVAFLGWAIWWTFIKKSKISAAKKLERQKIFWVLSFCFLPVQIAMALAWHMDDPIQLQGWLALTAAAGVGFTVWQLKRKAVK